MYQGLPKSLGPAQPILERALQETAGTVLQVAGSTKQPDPPVSLIVQAGPLNVLLTWNAPFRLGGVAGYRVYKDNESNLITAIHDPSVRQVTVPLPANTPTALYVSCVNALGIESVKVLKIGSAGVSGTTPPSLPPGYAKEPSGGAPSSGQQKRNS
jgi:hypothetical protein